MFSRLRPDAPAGTLRPCKHIEMGVRYPPIPSHWCGCSLLRRVMMVPVAAAERVSLISLAFRCPFESTDIILDSLNRQISDTLSFRSPSHFRFIPTGSCLRDPGRPLGLVGSPLRHAGLHAATRLRSHKVPHKYPIIHTDRVTQH